MAADALGGQSPRRLRRWPILLALALPFSLVVAAQPNCL